MANPPLAKSGKPLLAPSGKPAAVCKCCGPGNPCFCDLPSTINVSFSGSGTRRGEIALTFGVPPDQHTFYYYVIETWNTLSGIVTKVAPGQCVFDNDSFGTVKVETYGPIVPGTGCTATAPLFSSITRTTFASVEIDANLGIGGGLEISVGLGAEGTGYFGATIHDICCRNTYTLTQDQPVCGNPTTTATVSLTGQPSTCPCDGCCRILQLITAGATRTELTQTTGCAWIGVRSFISNPFSFTTVFDLFRSNDNHWQLVTRLYRQPLDLSQPPALICQSQLTSTNTPDCPDAATWPSGADACTTQIVCIFCGDENTTPPAKCGPQPCPANCSACIDSGTATIASDGGVGFSGGWLMSQDTPNCFWSNGGDGGREIEVTCGSDGKWHATAAAVGAPATYIEWTADQDGSGCAFGLTWTMIHNGFNGSTPTFVMTHL